MRCTHLGAVKTSLLLTEGCEECLKMGDSWVHLRLCRTCGHVGCCNSSKNKHATKRFHATGHPVITSIEPGETWSWCYIDEVLIPGQAATTSAAEPTGSRAHGS